MPPASRTGVSALLSGLDKDIQRTERSIENLQQDLESLRAARQAVSGIVLSHAVQPRTPKAARPSWTTSRTDEITKILGRSTTPLTVDDILRELRNIGRPDQKPLVHSTLSYLQRKGDAYTVERGQWVLTNSKRATLAA